MDPNGASVDHGMSYIFWKVWPTASNVWLKSVFFEMYLAYASALWVYLHCHTRNLILFLKNNLILIVNIILDFLLDSWKCPRCFLELFIFNFHNNFHIVRLQKNSIFRLCCWVLCWNFDYRSIFGVLAVTTLLPHTLRVKPFWVARLFLETIIYPGKNMIV